MIVVTRQNGLFSIEGCLVVNSLTAAIELAEAR